jgi:hypothetical protein
MTPARTTVLVDGQEHEVDTPRGAFLLSTDDVERVTGWVLRAEGLCRGDVCVPVRDVDGLVVDGDVELEALARALGRPIALDPDLRVAAIADAPGACADALATLRAPDFTLPTLDGSTFTLSAVGRKKKLLFAWASW